MQQVGVVPEQHRHLLIHVADGLLAFAVHVQDLQERLGVWVWVCSMFPCGVECAACDAWLPARRQWQCQVGGVPAAWHV